MNVDPVEISHVHKKEEFPWNENIRTIIFAILLAMTFRTFAFEPFHIPSGSMKSNLLVGDFLFVSKYSYGYSRYSFPFGIHLFDGRILETKPKRGDVVVFRLPPKPSIDYIKRLIGLPGDKIQVREGILYINGKPLLRHQLDDFADTDGDNMVQSIARFSETLPEGKTITILKGANTGPANNTKLFEVPPGHYFMMGDNRDNSRDSRFQTEPMDVGYVPEENLVGRAEIIFFSADNSASLTDPISWLTCLRLNRFLKLID